MATKATRPLPLNRDINTLPAGFSFHCHLCRAVIPSDAPAPEGFDNCIYVLQPRMSRFLVHESVAAQHLMATATWSLIFHAAHAGTTPDAASVEYLRSFKHQRREHYLASAAAVALTPQQIAAEKKHRGGRDAWLHA